MVQPVYAYSRVLVGTTFTKQSAEKVFLGVDFTDVLDDTDFIDVVSCTVTAIDLSTGLDATATVIDGATMAVIVNTDGVLAILEVMVMAGTNNKNYKVTFKGVTDTVQTWECDLTMRIRDI